MKHSICGFNHTALCVTFKLDYTDAQILRCIIDFRDSGKMKKEIHDGKEFLWIYHSWIMDELPFLGASNHRTISNRFSKYVNNGLMEKYIKNGNMTFYRFVPESIETLMSFPEFEQQNIGGGAVQTAGRCSSNSRAVQFKQQGGAVQTAPIDPSTNNPITSILNTNIHLKERSEKSCDQWKTNFDTYLERVNEAKVKILTTPELFNRPLKYWPKLDIQKSLEKSIEDFWGTEVGWKLKIKQSKKVKTFNMVETLLKNIDKNKVFKPFQREQDSKPRHREL